MTVSEVLFENSRRYSSMLREADLFGIHFLSKELTFDMQPQTQSNWCWAATATSVSHFYWFLSNWTQCLVASYELNRGDCCDSPVPSACNVIWYLDRALTRTNNFVSWSEGPASFEQVRAQIDAGRPVGARIGWGGGGGHFVVIYGYSFFLGMEHFDIDDSLYGKSHLSVSDFSSNYQGSGTWTHTYFTKGYKFLPIKQMIPREPILRRVWEVRPLLKLKREATDGGELQDAAEEWDASLGMAHHVYSLGLDSLTTGRELRPEPIGIRVYERMAEEAPRAFFDISDDEDPRVQQLSASKNHLEPFARGLSEAVATAERSDQECELRLLRVPALNFEALWLSYEGEAADLLVPLFEVGPLTPYQAVPFDEAMDTLREAARPLAEMDDMMGA